MSCVVVTRRESRKIGTADRYRIDVISGEVGIPREELALVRLVKIETDANLIVIVRSDNGRRITGGSNVARRIEVRNIYSDGIKTAGRKLIVFIRNAAGCKIDERMSQAREIALLLCIGGNCR